MDHIGELAGQQNASRRQLDLPLSDYAERMLVACCRRFTLSAFSHLILLLLQVLQLVEPQRQREFISKRLLAHHVGSPAACDGSAHRKCRLKAFQVVILNQCFIECDIQELAAGAFTIDFTVMIFTDRFE